jgi:hypothetical protein
MQPQQNDKILNRIGRKLFKNLYAQIGLLQDQLAAWAAREAQALRVASTMGELVASNERADSLARSLADVARLQEHVAALSAHIQEHLPTLGNLLLSRFAEAQAVLPAKSHCRPLTLSPFAVDRTRNSGPPQPAQRIGCWSQHRGGGSLSRSFGSVADGSATPGCSQAPCAKDVFDPARRAVGQDWLS